MANKYDPLCNAVIRDALEALVAEGHPRDKLLAAVETLRDAPAHVLAKLPDWVRKYRERQWGRGGLPYFQALHRALVSERAATASMSDTSWYDEDFWFWQLGLAEANFMVRKEGCTEIDLWRYLLLEKAKEQHNRKVREWQQKRAADDPVAHELRLLKKRAAFLRRSIAKGEARLAELRKRDEENPFLSLTGESRELEERLAERRELLRKHEAKIAELKAAKKVAGKAT